MAPLVSVVIPTYNHAHFLGRAIQSVIDQSYPHWEALVVDNHSQDHTDAVIAGFSDPRLRSFKIQNHGVIAASRNLGLRKARGEWIAFLDSDDCWYPTKLETIIRVATRDAYDVLSNDEMRVDVRTGARQVLRYGPYQDEFYKAMLVDGNRLSPSATVVRHEFLREHRLAFDESQEYVTVEDYGLWLDLARAGARFKFIPEVHGEFVVHGAGSSSQLSRHLQNGENLLRHHVFDIQQFHPAPERLWRRVSSRLRIGEAQQKAAMGQYATALTLAAKAFVGSPTAAARYLLLKAHMRIRRRNASPTVVNPS